MALKTGLEGKPWYFGTGVGLVLGGLIFGLGWWQFIQPIKEEIVRGDQTLADLQTKIQEGRAAKQQLPKFREEVRQLELELDKLLRILPARRNTPDLLRRIRALAEQGDFALKRFTPKDLQDKEFFSEWPIELSVDGTYHNLALFFDRISRFSRIINIENLQISAVPDPKSTYTISANFNAKTFVYKEPEPATPSTAAAPGAAAPPADSPAARARAGAPPPGEGV
ncbi:MAG TPA: type 4a pilus biogenesis protein PilO [Thermoanaerobaculia bacterium]|nr:type 4a pilus biogenesis protein PilO [Thermoanaerobaculia bacterium]